MEASVFDTLFKKDVPHILEKIFLSLDYSSFKSCLMVNKTWNQFLTSDSLKRNGKSKFEEWLFKAAMAGQVGAVQHLLELGAEPDKYIGNYSGRTALHWAAVSDSIHVVKLLMHAGADPNRRDVNQKRPLHYANCIIVLKLLLNENPELPQDRCCCCHSWNGLFEREYQKMLLMQSENH